MKMSELLKAIDHLPEEELKDLIEYARLELELIALGRPENKIAD